MNHYSDNAVDVKVWELFKGYIGHACDVGANDGLFGSNTLGLEELGWTVLCVEPNPLLAKEGQSRRKLWREVACSKEDSDSMDFYSVNGHTTYASSSSLGIRSGPAQDPPESSVFKVKCRRLDRVLEEAGFPKLDYLTVDVEGWEPEVMEGFTVERWKPKVIVLEEWSDDLRIQIPGYKRVEKRQYDNIYVREDV